MRESAAGIAAASPVLPDSLFIRNVRCAVPRAARETEIAMTTIVALPGFTARRPVPEDAQPICDLIGAMDEATLGEAGLDPFTPEDIREGWRSLDLEQDAWVFEAPGGELAAYGELTDRGSGQLIADGYVHPAFAGRGLGSALARLFEERARALVGNAPEGARVALSTGLLLKDAAARDVFERAGFTLARTHWQMRIDLDREPAAPAWPEGVTVRTAVAGRDERAIFEAVEEAFQDHWGHVPRTFEQWARQTRRSDFDPMLWLLAFEGEALAGVCLCWRRPEQGWVGTLGVRRSWRQRGLGMALLLEAFGAFWRRGMRRVGLGVDAQSLTGATRLYERAGMRPSMEIAVYEKELRAGEDLSTRELAS